MAFPPSQVYLGYDLEIATNGGNAFPVRERTLGLFDLRAALIRLIAALHRHICFVQSLVILVYYVNTFGKTTTVNWDCLVVLVIMSSS